MSETQNTSYEVSITGLWNTEHRLTEGGAEVGRLAMRRNRAGAVVAGRYEPKRGEVLVLSRDPGLLRSQFSMWTERREWLGSSLRSHFVRREIQLHAGSRPLRILPVPGLKAGWQLVAPKTGIMGAIRLAPLRRRARIEIYRRLEFELVVFAYFLGSQIAWESIWPGPDLSDSEDMIGACGLHGA
jgi:hypothetical protein